MSARRPLATAALFAVVACAAGCGGGDDSSKPDRGSDPGRPVSDEQALVMARLLQRNLQAGGATFTGKLTVQGVELPMSGRVDFRAGRGEAVLREPAAASRRYFWTRRAVYAQAAPNSKRYVTQPPNPERDPVHAAVAVINLLSAETIDNTANIKDQNARYLGRDTLAGRPVDVYRYGPDGNTTYWVDRGTGLLTRVRARFEGSGDPVVVTLTDHKPVRIALPANTR